MTSTMVSVLPDKDARLSVHTSLSVIGGRPRNEEATYALVIGPVTFHLTEEHVRRLAFLLDEWTYTLREARLQEEMESAAKLEGAQYEDIFAGE